MNELIRVENLRKSFPSGEGEVEVLKGLDVSIKEGDYSVIIGPSGAGKSTLLFLLAGLEKPTAGKILWRGKELHSLSEEERACIRRESIGFIFQFFNLLPELNVLENVAIAGWKKWGWKKAREQATQILEELGMSNLLYRFPAQLSGGEQQRVAIARALINNPLIIFADEPTGNLDEENGRKVIELLEKIRKEKKTALLLATHRLDFSQRGERTLFLENGKIIRIKEREVPSPLPLKEE